MRGSRHGAIEDYQPHDNNAKHQNGRYAPLSFATVRLRLRIVHLVRTERACQDPEEPVALGVELPFQAHSYPSL